MVLFQALYNLLWGDLVTIPLPGGSSLGLSLLVLILVPAGLYFTVRTRFLPFRLFPEMFRVTMEKNTSSREGISGLQALIVSTACRVGMGNLVGVVAAISAGGAGAVFWMWLMALIGSSTAFVEATLAQIYKETPLRRLARGTCLLSSPSFCAKGQPAQTLGAGGTVCPLRPSLLVRHQSGYRQHHLRLL